MKVKVLYFAQVAEKTGVSNEEIEVPAETGSEELLKVLKQKYPAVADLSFNIAVDQVLIRNNVELSEGSEIALLPPFAGG